MSAQHAPTHPDVLVADYLDVLHDLIGRGANLARMTHENAQAEVQAQAKTQAKTQGGAEGGAGDGAGAEAAPSRVAAVLDRATITFDRAARCVRRSIVLARHLAQPLPDAAPADPAAHAARRASARKHILRAVQQAIQQNAETDQHAERLQAEAMDRLDSPELEQDIETLPPAEIIQEIVRDLGVAAEGAYAWKRRTPQDAAALAAWAAAPPGTPRNSLPPLRPPPGLNGLVLHHPDDLIEPRLLDDQRLDAACARENARKRLRQLEHPPDTP